MDLSYTLAGNGDGTATFETFTINPDGSATQTGVYAVRLDEFLATGIEAAKSNLAIVFGWAS